MRAAPLLGDKRISGERARTLRAHFAFVNLLVGNRWASGRLSHCAGLRPTYATDEPIAVDTVNVCGWLRINGSSSADSFRSNPSVFRLREITNNEREVVVLGSGPFLHRRQD